MKGAFVDAIAYLISALTLAVQPFLFGMMWIFFILLGKTLMTPQQRHASDFVRAFIIGAPMGVLALMVSVEHGIGQYTAIAIGAAVSIVAEQVFKGDWFKATIDTALEIIKARFTK